MIIYSLNQCIFCFRINKFFYTKSKLLLHPKTIKICVVIKLFIFSESKPDQL